MSSVQYKTRGGSSPYGKPRIYFTCHPKDFEQYFEQISKQILNLQNCVIYYRKPNDCNYSSDSNSIVEDERLDLNKMQLFVIPITNNLLTENNNVIESDYPYAINNKIPVLSIMCENDLDKEYYKLFGKIQYILFHELKTNQQKLELYLNKVLANDTLLKSIHNVFDKRIFISYRRDDKEQAKKIITEIHKLPEFYNTATWYDDYILPEDVFPEVISESILNSDIFMLLVSPRLINLPNYVHSDEYPLACKNNKTIIPISIEKTDLSELYRVYEKLENYLPTSFQESNEHVCFNMNDTNLLKQALMSCFTEEKLKQSLTPQDEYYLGVAYLLGIEVEVNKIRGVLYIKKAAKRGCVEAVKKLIDMYGNGVGVEIDREKQIDWMYYLCNLYRCNYKKEPNISNLFMVLTAYSILAEKLFLSGYLSESIKTTRKNLSAAKALVENTLYNIHLNSDHAKLAYLQTIYCWYSEQLSIMGSRLIAQKNHNSAEELFIESNKYLLKMKNGDDDTNFKFVNELTNKYNINIKDSTGLAHDISQNYNCLGQIKRFQKDYELAIHYYKAASDCVFELAKEYVSKSFFVPKDFFKEFESYKKFNSCIRYNANLIMYSFIDSKIEMEWCKYKLYNDDISAMQQLLKLIELTKAFCVEGEDERFLALIATAYQHLAVVSFEKQIKKSYEYINIALTINKYITHTLNKTVYNHNLYNDEQILLSVINKMKRLGLKNNSFHLTVEGLINEWNDNSQYTLSELFESLEENDDF